MRVTWRAKVRLLSLEHLYMVDDLPETPPPPHPLWQAPLVFAPRDASVDELAPRVRRAGELWLTNYDVRLQHELVIAHVELPWFMAFQRGTRPDEGSLLIGPYAHRILKPSDAQPLFELPLCFRETEQATSRDLWRLLARDHK